MTTLYWFRNDLRLRDNPALAAAVKSTNDLIPIFILDDSHRSLGGAQRWWLHHSLTALSDMLRKKGITLLLKKGDTKKIIIELIKKYQPKAIYWNRHYEPVMLQLEKELECYCNAHDVEVQTFSGNVLTEPNEVKNKAGNYFKVFTPYWKMVSALIEPLQLQPTPRHFSQQSKVHPDRIENWGLLPTKPDWSQGLKIWRVGEKAAQQVLKRFIDKALGDYAQNRDRPDLLGTSRLSPYLHFGEISVRQVWNVIKEIEIKQPRLRKGANAFLRQLVWREFSYYLLFHFPLLDKKNFYAKFDHFRWKKSNKNLRAWQKGLTGYPIVDAGMRELWASGYLHNRVRMIVASFLTKDLLIHWREGEKWFWDTLVDADLANNAMGWQWVAGSGADAAPYFRIFNPILQGKKFDPKGDYVRKWVPELTELSNKYIHCPIEAPQKMLEAAGIILGRDYPLPLVDHKEARERAMKHYKDI